MIGALGHLAVILALLAAALGSIASFAGGRRGDADLIGWGRRAAFVVTALVAVAVVVMEIALISHDFSVRYVVDVGSRETPLYYTIISLWGALEGSILFWAFLLSLYTTAFVLAGRRFSRSLPYATGVLLATASFFLFVIAGVSDPFAPVSPVPADGNGPNVLLQNHWMMGIHPPLLYLGYVGLSVPFAIAMGALLRGASGADTFRLIRRWALIPWVFLSLGIAGGMWWSYAVLGWGGYWSWDPVENASVMPWLVTTAFLHSLQVQERRRMLKTWTLSLVIAAFLLSVLGTFLTRSGVLASVHSFTQSSIGPVFLVFFAAVLVLSLGLLFARSGELAAPAALDAVICRETAFLVNNLLLVAATFTILLGTMFPLVAQATQGAQLTVGAPYFNQIAVPIGVALLFLMGVGPLLPWGFSRLEDLQYRLLPPVMIGVAVTLLLVLIGVRGVGALAAFGLAAFVLAVTLGRVLADIRARRRGTGDPWLVAAGRVFTANPRRYGGYLAHIGVVLAVIGFAASQTYQIQRTATLHPSEKFALDGYQVTYQRLRPHGEPNRMVLGAQVALSRGADRLGSFVPSLNYYPGQQQPVVTPAVREEPLDLVLGVFQGRNPLPDLAPILHGRNPLEDVYLVLQAIGPPRGRTQPDITLQVFVNPMVGFIWLGGLLLGLGGAVSLLPALRRRRVEVTIAEGAPLEVEEAVV